MAAMPRNEFDDFISRAFRGGEFRDSPLDPLDVQGDLPRSKRRRVGCGLSLWKSPFVVLLTLPLYVNSMKNRKINMCIRTYHNLRDDQIYAVTHRII